MDLPKVVEILGGRPFWFSAIHDYTLKDDHISMLGIYEESLEYLRTLISADWVFVEKRRNPENDFLRIDIVKKSK
ncbi:hypothetical protein [Paenibacillus pini]|uniref:hypothetical protein n=1 Tax=Paenibacillus pini TaxID=669461 RepID=UPI00056402DC|nr:hypothetical protein [Paenibacillus pini]